MEISADVFICASNGLLLMTAKLNVHLTKAKNMYIALLHSDQAANLKEEKLRSQTWFQKPCSWTVQSEMALQRTASKCLSPSRYSAAWKFSEEWSANVKVTKIIHDYWSFSYCENEPFIIFWDCWTPDSISNLCFHCGTSEKKYHILRV